MSDYIIFGSTSCVGQALIKNLVKDKKHRLMLVSRSRPDLFKDILSDNVVEFSGYDLTDSSCIEPLKKNADAFFDGPFNVVSPIGGYWDHLSFEEVSLDEAVKVTNSQYMTVYCAALITLPLLRKRKGGKLITFSCHSVRYLYPWMAPYCAGKAAVEALTQCIAHEYAQYKITANCLRLSSLATDTVIESKPYGDTEHYMKVDELAKIIRSLCESPDTYINGSVLELYEYSQSFYGQGYFERIRKKR